MCTKKASFALLQEKIREEKRGDIISFEPDVWDEIINNPGQKTFLGCNKKNYEIVAWGNAIVIKIL